MVYHLEFEKPIAEMEAKIIELGNMDKGGNIHGVVGKMSFANEALAENVEFFINAIEKAKPSSGMMLMNAEDFPGTLEAEPESPFVPMNLDGGDGWPTPPR